MLLSTSGNAPPLPLHERGYTMSERELLQQAVENTKRAMRDLPEDATPTARNIAFGRIVSAQGKLRRFDVGDSKPSIAADMGECMRCGRPCAWPGEDYCPLCRIDPNGFHVSAAF